ncbi:MAG: TolC family outer membrane protein [Candidatus Sedimenticola sp. (ex Thyasira tokunagai)]
MNALKSAAEATILSMGLMAASTGHAVSLQDAIQHTLTTSPDILMTTNERLARDEEVRQARSGYYPEIDANAGIGYEWTDSPTTRSSAPSNGDEELTRKEASLELRQMLFDGFATKSEVERQQARVSSASHKVWETKEKTSLRAVEVYLELLRQKNLLALAEENLLAHQRIFDQIERRSESGVARKADLEQITGRLALADSNVIASKNNVIEAEANYQRVIGNRPEDSLERPTVPADAIPATVEAAVAKGMENHPTLKSAQSDIDATTAQHRAAKHAFYPRFDLEVKRTWNDDLDGVMGKNEDFTAMLRMRWNLYKGHKDQARRNETAHLINEAKDIHNRAVRQAEEGIRLSWASYEATTGQLNFLQKHVDASKATRKAYGKQFDIGQRSLLDLLDTENEVFESSKAHLTADHTNLFAQYRILTGMGTLLESIGISKEQ